MLCVKISICSVISLCALIQSRFPLVALNCVHIFLSCKKRQEQKQQPWTTPSVFFFFWWIWRTTSCYWRKQRRCQTHSLESFHGIHHCCQEYHYLWYNIKGPSESVNVFESFLMENINIIPVGKMHTCISFITSGWFLTFFVFFFFKPQIS